MISRKTNSLPAWSKEEIALARFVVRMLRDGYGVEDIRVRADITEGFSRLVIRHLRDRGMIADIYRDTPLPKFFGRAT